MDQGGQGRDRMTASTGNLQMDRGVSLKRLRGSRRKGAAIIVGVGPGNGAAFARRFAAEATTAVASPARSTGLTSRLAKELPMARADAWDAAIADDEHRLLVWLGRHGGTFFQPGKQRAVSLTRFIRIEAEPQVNCCVNACRTSGVRTGGRSRYVSTSQSRHDFTFGP